ncbi:MAG: IPT/TIG domain-containing protein, partial [Planctomycetota bacterium]
MRCVVIFALLVLSSTFTYAQNTAPAVPAGLKAVPSPDSPSLNLPNMGAPELLGVDPDRGSVAGGEAVTLTGKRFTIPADMTITFGDTEATDIHVVNPRTVTCLTPAHDSGVVDITVSTRFGSDTLPGAFTYYNPPELSGVSPEHGATAGGTPITLSGSCFTFSADTTITFDSLPAGNVNVIDANTATCDTPAHMSGAVDVTLTNSNGSDTLPGAFTYHNPPQVVSIDPDNGPDAGGTAVVVYGSDFSDVGITTVTFDGLSATSVTVVDSMILTCTTPAHGAAIVDVVVTNDFGTGTLANGYTYTSS